MTSPHAFEEAALIQELSAHVGSHAGKALTPKEVHLISALPKTRNGKIVRRLLKGRMKISLHPIYLH